MKAASLFKYITFQSGPILESKGMHAIFRKRPKRGQKNVKNGQEGQNIWKLDQKCIKFKNILLIPLNKLLE